MKNARPLSFLDICHPGGNGPSSSDALAAAAAAAVPRDPVAAGVWGLLPSPSST